jgi:hypothetical protein
MKIKIPTLTKKRIKNLLDQACFDEAEFIMQSTSSLPESELTLHRIVRSMKYWNLQAREEDIRNLMELFGQNYFLDNNSEGSRHWIATVLAIKDLCLLTQNEIKEIVDGLY